MQSTKTVLMNTLNPVTQGTTVLGGLTFDLLVEGIMTYAVRWLLKAHKGFWRIIIELMVSSPLIGMGGYLQPKKGDKSDITMDFITGVVNVPALFLAQYLVEFQNYQYGFHVPKFDFFDIIITAIMRPVSRVTINFIARQDWFLKSYIDGYNQFQTAQKLQVSP